MDMTIRLAFQRRLREKDAVVVDASEFERFRHPAEIDQRTIDIAADILERCGPVSACQYLHCLIAEDLKPSHLAKKIVAEALMPQIPYPEFFASIRISAIAGRGLIREMEPYGCGSPRHASRMD